MQTCFRQLWGDFEEEEVPQERANTLKKMLRRFKTVALRIERRKNCLK